MDPIGHSELPRRDDVAAVLLALGAPLLFLAMLGFRYWISDSACASALARVGLEVTGAVGVIAMVAVAVGGWSRLRRFPEEAGRAQGEGGEREDPERWRRAHARSSRTLALLSVLLGGLFTLLALAQWMPTWILGACHG